MLSIGVTSFRNLTEHIGEVLGSILTSRSFAKNVKVTMKNRNARLARLIVVLVFGVGLVLFTTAIIAGRAQEPRSFVATYMVFNNGSPTSIRTEIVKATGEWKNTAYGLGSGATRTLIDTLDAQYQIGSASIDFLTSADADQTRNLDRSALWRSTRIIPNSCERSL